MLAQAHDESFLNALQPERFHPRVDANFMIKVLGHGRSILYKARDLSMDGVFVVDHPGKVGNELHLTFPLPDEDVEVRVIGKIVRCDHDGVAVKFDELDWDEILAFARYLHPRLP